MIVYRLEHPLTGNGPYCTSEGTPRARKLASELIEEHGNRYIEHPSPLEDDLSTFTRRCMKGAECYAFFGCSSIELLYNWFKEFWSQLIDAGFQVVQYEVESYQIGKSGLQLAFDMRKAKKL